MMEYKVAQFYGKFVQKVPTGLFTLIVTSKRPKKSYDIWATFERNFVTKSFQKSLNPVQEDEEKNNERRLTPDARQPHFNLCTNFCTSKYVSQA